jgi:hypothetical protein
MVTLYRRRELHETYKPKVEKAPERTQDRRKEDGPGRSRNSYLRRDKKR